MHVDIHQHIWTEPLLGRLAARRAAPLIRRSNGLMVLHFDAEQPYIIDVVAEQPASRSVLDVSLQTNASKLLAGLAVAA